MAQAKTKNSTKSDHVAELGAYVLQLCNRFDELDAVKAQGAGAIYRDRECRDIDDRIDCLRAYMTTITAGSLEGAAVHLSLAYGIIRDIFERGGDVSDFEQSQAEDRFTRLMFSVLFALEDATGTKDRFQSLGIERQMSRRFNPWVPSDAIVYEIEEEARENAKRIRSAG